MSGSRRSRYAFTHGTPALCASDPSLDQPPGHRRSAQPPQAEVKVGSAITAEEENGGATSDSTATAVDRCGARAESRRALMNGELPILGKKLLVCSLCWRMPLTRSSWCIAMDAWIHRTVSGAGSPTPACPRSCRAWIKGALPMRGSGCAFSSWLCSLASWALSEHLAARSECRPDKDRSACEENRCLQNNY